MKDRCRFNKCSKRRTKWLQHNCVKNLLTLVAVFVGVPLIAWVITIKPWIPNKFLVFLGSYLGMIIPITVAHFDSRGQIKEEQRQVLDSYLPIFHVDEPNIKGKELTPDSELTAEISFWNAKHAPIEQLEIYQYINGKKLLEDNNFGDQHADKKIELKPKVSERLTAKEKKAYSLRISCYTVANFHVYFIYGDGIDGVHYYYDGNEWEWYCGKDQQMARNLLPNK